MDLWQSLVLAGTGGTLTLLGTWTGFQFQAREQRRVRAEQLTRDGLLRLHSDRIASYTSFYKEAGAMRASLYQLARTPDSHELRNTAREQRSTLWSACATVTLVGSHEAASTAWDLLNYATDIVRGQATFDSPRYGRLIWEFILTARLDLNFPDAPGTPRTEAWKYQNSVEQTVGDTSPAPDPE